MVTHKKNIVILGAGLSGLSTAWFLQKNSKEKLSITIIDQADSPGGKIKSLKKEGFILELGPHSCRVGPTSSSTLSLIQQLNLEEKVLLPSPVSKKKFLMMDQKLYPFPHSFPSLFTSPLTLPLLKACWKDLFTRKKAESQSTSTSINDESVHHFISRHFGTHFSDTFFDPMVSGIYAGDPKKLSIKSCFPILYQKELEHGSIVRSFFARKKATLPLNKSSFTKKIKQTSLFSFEGGMETLITALKNQLDVQWRLSEKITHLSFDKSSNPNNPQSKSSTITTNKDSIKADAVFSTLPPKPLGTLLHTVNPLLSSKLLSIPSSSIAVIHLVYKHAALKKEGFGYLVPFKESDPLLGVIWDSSVFPQHCPSPDSSLLTVMIGGTRDHYSLTLCDKALIEQATLGVKRHLNIVTPPDITHCTKITEAIPQYEIGHSEILDNIQNFQSQFPQFFISGWGFHGISLNDCIQKSESNSNLFLKNTRF